MIYIGMLVISIIGTILHFSYEMSNHNKVVAIFSAVNESTWEHIKMCITAILVWSLFDGYIYGLNGNYFIGKSLSILTVIIGIPLFFYTYTYFTKKPILVIDIISFYVIVICSQLVFAYFININSLPFIFSYFSFILFVIELCSYIFLTFQPLKNFIFKDPITHKYGLKGHTHNHKD